MKKHAKLKRTSGPGYYWLEVVGEYYSIKKDKYIYILQASNGLMEMEASKIREIKKGELYD